MAVMTVQTDSNDFRFGTQSLKATTGATGTNAIYPGSPVPVVPGESRTLSAYLKTAAPITGGALYLRIAQSGLLTPVLAESIAITDTTLATDAPDGWQRVSATLVIPDGMYEVRPFVQYSGATAGLVFWIDGIKFEQGDVVSTWQENIVSKQALMDQNGLQVDAVEGGIFRLRGSGGAARDTVSLGVNGLQFGGDTQLSSPVAGQIQIGDGTGSIAGKAPIVRVYTAGATWTKPAGLAYATVEVVGSGGGGGGTALTAAGQSAVGGHGGGGGYARKLFAAALLPATCTVVVGAGGAGATAGLNAGTVGNLSSFAGTGITTVVGNAGFGGAGMASSVNQVVAGGGGGTGSGGDINVRGGSGSNGVALNGLPIEQGSPGGTVLGNGTRFVASMVGGGNGGVGNDHGTGGEGGARGPSQVAAAGGAGGDGVAIVTEYYGP